MKVEIYSTPTCPYCLLAKQYFDDKKVPCTNYDVSEDHAKATEMVEISGQMGVPVIVISKDENDKNPEVIIGFDKETIEEVLQENKS